MCNISDEIFMFFKDFLFSLPLNDATWVCVCVRTLTVLTVDMLWRVRTRAEEKELKFAACGDERREGCGGRNGAQMKIAPWEAY